MKRSELAQLVFGGVLFLWWVVFLIYEGTLQIDIGKITQDLWVLEVDPRGVSGELSISPYGMHDELLQYIIEAKYSLDGWFYQVTDTDVIKALDTRSQMWTQMRLIIESATYGGNTKSYTDLTKKLSDSTIQIQSDELLNVNFNHTKTFIRDHEDALISTANLSYPSFYRNREYRVRVDDTEVVDSLEELYEADRQWRPLKPNMIHDSLLVCPINCRSGLNELLSEVQTSVSIQAQYIEDPQIIQQLRELDVQWVQVRLLVGEFQDEEDLVWLDYHIQEDLYNHSKALLIDQESLLIGSMNYSTNSIERNREISILLNNPQALGLFRWQFEKDWEKNKGE